MQPDIDDVVVLAAPDAIARLACGALESEGVPARCERDSFGAVYGLNAGRFATRVLVGHADVERARALLAEIEAAP